MEPFFLVGSQGALFAVYHPPVNQGSEKGAILYVPPFAEEMNKSRRMAALQAQRMAAAGWGVLIPDLYGTGDSAGDFADARWTIWQDDLLRCADWLRQRGYEQLTLWGLRLGGLLAMEQVAAISAARLLLWQPVLSGQRFFHQFLRLRLTADRFKGRSDSMGQLQEKLAAGHSLEVAGYDLHPDLALALERVRPVVPPTSVHVDWLEVAGTVDAALSPASQRVVEAWRASGVTVCAQTVIGDAFWTTQEIAEAPVLLEATLTALLDNAP
ncbi:MAG: hydrolase 2, exosortase A system-associated [Candidatus Competibacteraceae bacterium]|nr:hydrolase 2, exosortase A system-associated [Candidatus Competibacteraceae bacterium]